MASKKRPGSKKTKQRRNRQGKSKRFNGRPAVSMDANQNITTILERAHKLLDKGKNEQAAAEVDMLLDSLDHKSHRLPYLYALRIQGFSLAQSGKFEEAVKVAQKALELDENYPDFNYLAAYSYIPLGEFELAETYARRFIDVVEGKVTAGKEAKKLSDSSDKLSLVYNYLGVALREMGRHDEACQAFESALNQNGKSVDAYLNYAKLLHSLKRDNDAAAVLKKAVKAGVETPEIKMLLNSYKPHPEVSVCMIVKNEEKFLDNCLNSVKALADEIIIVDTGSTDRTVEIARSHGAKVYFHEWENDFSKARNYSLSYATKEWIFVIDADEELYQEDIPSLKNALTQDRYNVISINVYNLTPEGREDVATFLPSIRLFRRKVGALYDGIVHNQLTFNAEREVILRLGVRLKHYGYGLDAESMKRKHERSRKLLEEQISENPDNAFAHFNLAQLYRGMTDRPMVETASKVIEHAQRAIELTSPDDRSERGVHLMAHHQVASAHMYLEDFENSLEYCKRALKLKPDYIDPLMTMGQVYGFMHDYDNAAKYFNRYLDILENYDESGETDQIIFLYVKSKYMAYYGLGLISEEHGKNDEAIDWFNKAIELFPGYIDSHFRAGRLLYNKGMLKEALDHLKKEIEYSPKNWSAHFIMGEIYRRNEEYNKAEQSFLKAYELQSNDVHVLYSLSKLYFSRNETDRAFDYLQKLKEADPNFVEAHRLMGDIHFGAGQYKEAVAAYTNFVMRKQGDVEVWNNLANAHLKLDEYEQAREYYQKALEVDSTFGLAHRNLAVCLFKMNDYEGAERIISDYLKLVPDDLSLTLLAGDIASKLDKVDDALNYYEHAVKMNPDSPEIVTSLADCYYRGGFYAAARMGYHQALKIDPNHEAARAKLEEIDAILGNRQQ